MDYFNNKPSRYSPDLLAAEERGSKDLRSVFQWLGRNRDLRILEVGCGAGSLQLALRERGYTRCHGIDLNSEFVRHGLKVLGVNIETATWRQYLESSDYLYDVIIALDVLEHLPKEELVATLRASRAHLSSTGLLIIRTPNALCPFVLPTLYGDLTHQFVITPLACKGLLRTAGFEGEITTKETRPTGVLANILFVAVHWCLVKPLLGLTHYHFHGEFPSHITPNIIVCAKASAQERARA